MKIKNIIVAALLMLTPSLVSAQSYEAEGGQSIPVLTVNPNARNVAMGGNMFGESNTMMIYGNATSIYNSSKKIHVSATTQMFSEFTEDAGKQKFAAVSGSYLLGSRHGIHFGARYLGGLKYDIMGRKGVETAEPKDMTFDLGYSFKLNDNFSAQMSIMYLNSELGGDYSGSTVGFDIAAYYRTTINLMSGLDITAGVRGGNFGGQLEYDKGSKADLPSYAGAGGEFALNMTDSHRLTLAVDAKYFVLPEDSRMLMAGAGLEYTFKNMISLRGGYLYGEEENSSLTAGLGFEMDIITVDAAYIKGMGDNDVDACLVSLGVRF